MSPNTTCEVRSEDGAFVVIMLLGVVALMPFSNFFSILGGRYRIEQALKKLRTHRDPGEDGRLFSSVPSLADLDVTDARLQEYYERTEMRECLYSIIPYIGYLASYVAVCLNYGDGMTRSERIAFSAGFGLAGLSIYIATFSIRRNADYYEECLQKEIENLRWSTRERECKGRRRSHIEEK
ncbi:hypothetical protein MRS44_005027 [Fusarium solani]|uniref:uncharacterized protein n=1 Tax=Fusarium solani TaxID=169388 RepID=UPI0032C4892B|nr:hypothetical protein MRS44_005027 [Fusarium solani]